MAFRSSGWQPQLLGLRPPKAVVGRVHGRRLHAWIYVPPSFGDAPDARRGRDPIFTLEKGGHIIRELASRQPAGGAIVVYVSAGAVSVGPDSPHAAAGHAALLSAVRAFGVAWAQDSVRVNAILAPLGPSFQHVHPTRFPLRRSATPEDLAWPAVFLASGESSYVTAEALRVDGGYLADHYF